MEQETGETGVFALVNKRLGDHSEAAKIQRKSLESQTRGMNWSRDSKFGQQGQAQAPQDRKSLVASRVSFNLSFQFQHLGLVSCIAFQCIEEEIELSTNCLPSDFQINIWHDPGLIIRNVTA